MYGSDGDLDGENLHQCPSNRDRAEKEFSENDEIIQKRRDLHGVIIFGTECWSTFFGIHICIQISSSGARGLLFYFFLPCMSRTKPGNEKDVKGSLGKHS